MYRVFIFSSSYFEYIIINSHSSIFNFEIDCFVLLNENRLFKRITNIPVKYFDTINQCIDNSDLSIIVDNGQLPNKSTNILIDLCNTLNKKLVKIDIANATNSDCKTNLLLNNSINDHPTVLILYSGMFATPSIFEWKFYSFLSTNGISAETHFSQLTESINYQLQFSSLPTNISLNNNAKGCDMIVLSLNMGDKMQFLSSYLDQFNELLPDCIILLVRIDQKNAIAHIYNSIDRHTKRNMPLHILKSRYHLLPNNKTVLCDIKQNQILPNKIFIDSAKITNVFCDILSQISIPQGIVPIYL